jgi:hypothetical protein
MWTMITADERNRLLESYHAAGIAVMVAYGGETRESQEYFARMLIKRSDTYHEQLGPGQGSCRRRFICEDLRT